MRGFNSAFSRLPATRALLAGAAFLAGASVTRADALNTAAMDETAFSVPVLEPRGAAGIALPKPLPPSEAARIKRVFALQGSENMDEASRLAASIDTSTPLGRDMLGHILAQRYLARSTRPKADELLEWLHRYPTLPDASALHALLLTRLPAGMSAPPAPGQAALALDQSGPVGPVPEESEPATFTLARSDALDRAVHEAARNRGAEAVEKLLRNTPGLTATYASQLRGEAAQILFTLNRDGDAYLLGFGGMAGCVSHACPSSSLAGQMAGLAAWRMGRPDLARPMFEAAWQADLTTSALRAAAAFWSARAQLRTGHAKDYQRWMTRASAETNTFYGFLARRTLGLGYGFAPGGRDARDLLTIADMDAVANTPEGLRAFALLQVGQPSRAEAELRQLWPAATSRPELGRAIMLVAKQAGLLALAGQLADLVQSHDGQPRQAIRFPIPHLQPNGGFRVDPAMVYGITRTESNFDKVLISSAGATGLMQIMPDTASFLTGRDSNGGLRGSLRDPGFNLDLGQRYIDYLAQQEVVGGNVLRMLASYNSGPGNFGRWSQNVQDQGDPLLFIEAIPIDETRAFVPRALTFTWIYAARMKLPAPSLDELAAGAWPRYHPLPTDTSGTVH
jgi:soluble lytic murein transglycosylase